MKRPPNHTLSKSARRIKCLLIASGHTQRNIAKYLGVGDVAVSRIILSKTASRRIREEIAIRVGQPVEKLWPPRKPRRA